MSDTLAGAGATGGAPRPDRARRWIGPALLISLVINLFLMGFVVAGLLFRHPEPMEEFGPVPPSFFRMLHRGADGLPADDRAAMRRIMIREFPVIRPHFLKIEAARKALADVVGATPYDPAKVKEAFAMVDAAQAEMIAATHGAMIDGFGKLTPAQRERIAEMMRKQADRRMKGGRHPHDRASEKSDAAPLPLGPAGRPPAASDSAVSDSAASDETPPPDVPPLVSDALGLPTPPPPPPPLRAPPNAPANGLGFSGGTTSP